MYSGLFYSDIRYNVLLERTETAISQTQSIFYKTAIFVHETETFGYITAAYDYRIYSGQIIYRYIPFAVSALNVIQNQSFDRNFALSTM